MSVFALSGTVLLPGPSCENQYVSRDNATETPGEGNKSGELAADGRLDIGRFVAARK